MFTNNVLALQKVWEIRCEFFPLRTNFPSTNLSSNQHNTQTLVTAVGGCVFIYLYFLFQIFQ